MKKILVLLAIAFPVLLFAQNYKINGNAEIKVEGTSTLHDWHMVSEEASGTADIDFNQGSLNEFNDVKFSFVTETLKSGKSKMDELTYEALKTDKHPKMHFTMEGASVIKPLEGNKYKVTIKGKLTIAGTTKNVQLDGICKIKGSVLEITGSKKLKMTDFNVDPPTAVFGTIKTGDDINVVYKVNLVKEAL